MWVSLRLTLSFALAAFFVAAPAFGQTGSAEKRLPTTPATASAVATDCQVGIAEAELVVSDVRAKLYNMGNLFWRSFDPVYRVPKTGSAGAVFAFGLLVSGFVDSDFRAVGSEYGPFEFAPGPLDDAGNAPVDCAAFDRIWSVTDQDLRRYDDTGIATRDLRDWPADLGAEVIDGDGNPDNYDLPAGDRPRLFGTQTAFWVMNDVGVPHQRTGSLPLGIEVQVTAWAIASADAALDQATYYRYRVVNKSGRRINDMIVSLFADMDLGLQFEDDYIGSDPARDLGFTYNADNLDEDGYGTQLPAIGVRLLDARAGAVTYFNNGGCTDQCDPEDAEQIRFYQTGRWKDGEPFTIGNTGRGGTEATSFVYAEEPGAFWSEPCPEAGCAGDPIEPSDRRFLISTAPFNLATGASRDVTFALPFAFGTQNFGPVGNPTGSVQAMKRASDRIQAAFDDGSLLAPASRTLTLAAPTLLTPADGAELTLEDAEAPPRLQWSSVPGAEGYRILFDVERDGRTVTSALYTTNTEITIGGPPAGEVYTYRWSVEADGRLADGSRIAGERSETGTFTLFRYVPGLLGNNGEGIVEVASASGTDPCADTPTDVGCAGGIGGNTVWQDPDATGDYYISGGSTGGLSDLALNRTIADEDDVEVRFTAACAEPGACLAVYFTPASRNGQILSVPFEAWYLASTPDDPSDDLRMIPQVLENGDTPVVDFANTFTDNDLWGDSNAPVTERVYLFMPDLPDGYSLFNEAARRFGGPGAEYDRTADGDTQVDLADEDSEVCSAQGLYTDFCFRGPDRGRSYLYGNIVFADAAGDGTTPGVGTIVRFKTNKRQPVVDEPPTPPVAPLALTVYPNPAQGTATLAYTLPETGRTQLVVYDVLGRVVARLADEMQATDMTHTATLDTARLSAGVYVAVLVTEDGRQTRTFTVVR
ncbi:MAG: T9SS type A sorting domain-containing protein [Bacteroidota bacterium]